VIVLVSLRTLINTLNVGSVKLQWTNDNVYKLHSLDNSLTKP